jgi:hypothetical protein
VSIREEEVPLAEIEAPGHSMRLQAFKERKKERKKNIYI